MSHGIINTRDFVYGCTNEKDWHGLTIEKPAPLGPELFPIMRPVEVITVDGTKLGRSRSVLIAADDGQMCGEVFNPETFGYILPGNAWNMVAKALAGTNFTVERVGMLWDRSFWFVSIHLDELATIARPGEKFQLNFSGGLDGSKSPQGELSHIRAVCHNTISLSRATGERLFKIKQTSESQGRLDKSAAEVEKACGMAKAFNAALASLESKPATVADARNVFAGEVVARGGNFKTSTNRISGTQRESRSLNMVNDLVTLFQRGEGNHGATRADILNGFTQRMTRGGAADSDKNPWTAVASSEFGTNAERKAEFVTMLADDARYSRTVEIGAKALVDSGN